MSVSIPAEATSHESAAFGAILKWSRECPAWQRDALRRLCVKDRLDEADVGELVEMCKNEGVGGVSLEARHLRDPGGARAVVTLGAVHSVDHVNALATGERLTFGEVGLTIVYGDNGSGKSGYARILKQACRARVSKGDTVHDNVYAARPGIPTAIIDFSVDGQGRSAILDARSADRSVVIGGQHLRQSHRERPCRTDQRPRLYATPAEAPRGAGAGLRRDQNEIGQRAQ